MDHNLKQIHGRVFGKISYGVSENLVISTAVRHSKHKLGYWKSRKYLRPFQDCHHNVSIQ